MIWRIEWHDVTAYFDAPNAAKAKARAMRSALDAGYWLPGQSLKGLRCAEAAYVPPDVAVMDGQ